FAHRAGGTAIDGAFRCSAGLKLTERAILLQAGCRGVRPHYLGRKHIHNLFAGVGHPILALDVRVAALRPRRTSRQALQQSFDRFNPLRLEGDSPMKLTRLLSGTVVAAVATVLLGSAACTAFAATTYTWNGGLSASWAVAAS